MHPIPYPYLPTLCGDQPAIFKLITYIMGPKPQPGKAMFP
jgi:hypothetical protein